MGIVFGGPDAIRVFRRGPFGVSIENVNDEPAICMWAVPRRLGCGAMIVGLSAYHQYFELPSAKPTRYALERVIEGMQVMGFDPLDRYAAHTILDILYGFADDVVRLPPDLRKRPLPKNIEGFEIRETSTGKLVSVH